MEDESFVALQEFEVSSQNASPVPAGGEKFRYSGGEPKTIEDYERLVYDLQQVMEISRSFGTMLELPRLIDSILYISMAQMHVLGAGVYIRRAIDSDAYILGNNVQGFELDPTVDYAIPSDSKLVESVTLLGKSFTIEELEMLIPKDKDLKKLSSLNPSLIVPLLFKNHLNGILFLGERFPVGEEGFTPYEREQIFTIASLAAVAINNASLVELSSTDMMTHLKLKYYFFNVLTDKLDAALAHNHSLCVLMFDIDFFKKFNDTYGHACGDYVLQQVAKIIKTSIRSQDMASRYGGEEFTVMLSNTSKEEALAVSERIRQNIEHHDFFYEERHMKVTISGGLAIFSATENPITSAKVLVDQADKALYVSKRNGRNRITCATQELLQELENNE